MPDRLCRAEWGVQAMYLGLNLPSEARAFVASDGAENPIGLLLARSLHHSRALELARATPRPTVRVHFSIFLKNLTKKERASCWVLSKSIFGVHTVNFPHKPRL